MANRTGVLPNFSSQSLTMSPPRPDSPLVLPCLMLSEESVRVTLGFQLATL